MIITNSLNQKSPKPYTGEHVPIDTYGDFLYGLFEERAYGGVHIEGRCGIIPLFIKR